MSDPVSVLDGVGAVTTQKLAQLNILTVEQLSQAKSSDLSTLRNGSKHISTAKKYLEDRTTTIPQNEVKTPSKPEEDNDKLELEYLIEDHSWYEKKVVVALQSGDQVYLKEAKVFELCVEPGHRVSFICEWMIQESKDICEMTFTPQVICHWNVDLPPLTVDMKKEDIEALSHRHVLENTLEEVKLMQTIRHQNNSDF